MKLKFKQRRAESLAHEKRELENRLNAIEAMEDADFLEEIKKLHNEFMAKIWDLLRRGRLANWHFDNIASRIAEANDYMLLCGRIYTPIRFNQKLMKILNDQQTKLNEFKKAEAGKDDSNQAKAEATA